MKHLVFALAILGAAPTVAFAQVEDPPANSGQTATPTVPTPGEAAGQMSTTGSSPEIFKHGTMGLSFGVFNTSPTVNIDALYFADPNTAYDLLLGIHYAHTGDTTMGTPPVTIPGGDIFGFAIGAGYRMYQHHSARIHTFLEPYAVLSATDVSNFGDTLGIGVGGKLGAECMFADWFSISGTAGVELDFANKFKTITFATAQTGLNANFYWQ